MFNIFIGIALFGVAVGTYTDITTYEMPDWLSYALISTGIVGNLLFTLFFWDTYHIFRSLLGLGVSLLFGFLMFYTGQWGGGDTKLLWGLGALLGMDYPLRFDFFTTFLINLLFAGALYGLFWVAYVGLKSRKKVFKVLKKIMNQQKRIRVVFGILTLLLLLIIYISPLTTQLKVIFSSLVIISYFLQYLFVFVKAVEKTAMIRNISPEKLTEGDWIVDEIRINGKYITGPKDLGIEKKQIKKLLKLKSQGKIKTVKVKYGVPFIPSFLIALVYTIIFENIFLFFFL